MHKAKPTKSIGALEKKVPKNNKYSHVQGHLNTGMTVNKVKFVTASECAKRRDEIFFRITRSQLYHLLCEYESSDYETIGENMQSSGDLKIVTHDQSDAGDYSKPYLILDVREPRDYDQCHILQARSFPYTALRRDQLHSDIYRFRNKPETLIVLYCDDEKISRDAAKVIVDRGTDNIYLLTGGVTEFAADYPDFMEGIHPVSPRLVGGKTQLSKISEGRTYSIQATADEKKYSSALTASTLKKLGDKPPPLSGRNPARYSPTRTNKDTRSDMSNMSVAESIISKASARKGKF